MTLPSSGSISLSQADVELLNTSTTSIGMNNSLIRFLAGQTTANSAISMSQLRGSSYVIPSNAFFNTVGTYVYQLPETSGPTVKILSIGGGGGGGGGSARTAHNPRGPGGGGGSGEITYTTVTITPGQYIWITVGSGGAGGNACDGHYSPGTVGGGGSYSGVSINNPASSFSSTTATWLGLAYGGAGGDQGYDVDLGAICYGGAAGSGGVGTDVAGYAQTGGNAQYGVSVGGGTGGTGFSANVTVGNSHPYSQGTIGTGGIGNDTGGAGGTPYTLPTTGTVYGGGGGGGGSNNEFAGQGPGINGASGSQGAVFIWWGY